MPGGARGGLSRAPISCLAPAQVGGVERAAPYSAALIAKNSSAFRKPIV